MSEKLMKAGQVAEQLGISLNAVYDLFKTKELDGCLLGKKSIRFTQAQVDAYIDRKSTNNAGAAQE